MSMIPFRRHGLSRRNSNSLFDDSFFRSFFDMSDFFESSSFRVDIKDKGDHYVLEAELPGVEQNQIELTAQNGTLTIAANVNNEHKEERENYLYSERRTGHFQRSFNLEGIQEDKISASYRNGVLAVTLPKSQPAPEKQSRRIDIQ